MNFDVFLFVLVALLKHNRIDDSFLAKAIPAKTLFGRIKLGENK